MIIEGKVIVQPLPSLTWCFVIVQVHLLIFQRTPKPFSENVVHGPTSPVHADEYLSVKQTTSVLRAAK